MENKVKPGELYRHHKGNIYRVVYLAKHSETLEDLVIYVSQSNPESVWARPLSMWNETVIYNGKQQKRFEKI